MRLTPLTPGQHIDIAADDADCGDHTAAQTHALIAIAQLLGHNLLETYNAGVLAGAQAGAGAVAEAIGTVLGAVGVMPPQDWQTGQ